MGSRLSATKPGASLGTGAIKLKVAAGIGPVFTCVGVELQPAISSAVADGSV